MIGLSNGDVTVQNTNQTDKRCTFFTDEDVPVTSVRWIDNSTLITGNAGGHFVSYDCLKGMYV